MIISKILATLPERYKYFASAWESAPKEHKKIENLTARLIAEEQRTDESKETQVAFKTTTKKCYKCNSAGHLAANCKFKSNNRDRHCYE